MLVSHHVDDSAATREHPRRAPARARPGRRQLCRHQARARVGLDRLFEVGGDLAQLLQVDGAGPQQPRVLAGDVDDGRRQRLARSGRRRDRPRPTHRAEAGRRASWSPADARTGSHSTSPAGRYARSAPARSRCRASAPRRCRACRRGPRPDARCGGRPGSTRPARTPRSAPVRHRAAGRPARRPCAGSRPAPAPASSGRGPWRPATRATATAENASAPTPYTVSVGSTTSSLRRTAPTAASIPLSRSSSLAAVEDPGQHGATPTLNRGRPVRSR